MRNSSSKVRILIVEDEILLAHDISNRLSDLGYAIVGVAASADEALQYLATDSTVDLIVLDIVLQGDKDGIEFAHINNKRFGIPYIFLTSHADFNFVERAKSVKPFAYILKPFNDRQVMVAIEVALLNYSLNKPKKDLFQTPTFNTEENRVLQIKNSLFLKKEQHFQRVHLEDILFLQAENNYTSLHTVSKKYIYSIVLKKVESQLPKAIFIRVHRSFVVNIQLVTGFEGNTLYIEEKKLPIGKSYKENVFKLFQTI